MMLVFIDDHRICTNNVASCQSQVLFPSGFEEVRIHTGGFKLLKIKLHFIQLLLYDLSDEAILSRPNERNTL
jgi:hypothetical protein